MDNYFTLSDVSKRIQTDDGSMMEILKNISMNICKGDFVCIMGPSGCGKSVLLKIMDGIENLSEGKLTFGDIDCSKKMAKEIKSHIGYVFQQDNLLEWRTVYENVKLPLEIEKQTKDCDEKIRKALEVVGLSNYSDCYPKELSGGMRQRAAIARALVKDTTSVLLDQPFGALDAITRKILGIELLKIWEKTKKTMVMITNSVDEALMLANKIYVLSDLPGEIIYSTNIDIPYNTRIDKIELDNNYVKLKDEISKYIK